MFNIKDNINQIRSHKFHNPFVMIFGGFLSPQMFQDIKKQVFIDLKTLVYLFEFRECSATGEPAPDKISEYINVC